MLFHRPNTCLILLTDLFSREQELSNLLHEKRYLKALGLAISLDRPHTVLTVIKGGFMLYSEGFFCSLSAFCLFQIDTD